MQFQIQVVEVNEIKGKKNNRGGVYNQLEVVYKRDGKVEAKAFPEFANKEVYPHLAALQKGDVANVTVEKNDKGFWQWLNVSVGEAPMSDVSESMGSKEVSEASSSRPTPSKTYNSGTGRVIGNTYETHEERAAKQRAINAQSSLNTAIEALKILPFDAVGGSISKEVLYSLADEFFTRVEEKTAWPSKE